LERWLVISNCQTHGLTHCLSLQNPDVNVEACDIWQFRREADRWSAQISAFERIFLTDEILSLSLIDFSSLQGIIRVPDIEFGGYHPDLCYVFSDTGSVKSPMDDYHSLICLAAFKRGLSENQTKALFRSPIYEAGGYFDVWEVEKQRLFDRFAGYAFQMRDAFRRWSMQTNFMYSFNHPKIDCLYDIAAVASAKAGSDPILNPIRPHDNLCNGAIFPVYNEIAEQYGIMGCYDFKPLGQYRTLTLEQFISGSFEAYRRYNMDRLSVVGLFERRYEAIFNAI
jgi:hypothetical protein